MFNFSGVVTIDFSEIDYVSSEEGGRARVLLTQSGPMTENITVPVQAVSFQQFFGAGRTLSTQFDDLKLPNPAECKRTASLTKLALWVKCIAMHS